MSAKLNYSFLRALINLIIIIAILSILFSLINQINTNKVDAHLTTSNLVLVLAMSCVLLLISSLAWRTLLSKKHEKVDYLFTIEQTSMMLISKYVPGKVWAIFLRATMAKKLGFSKERIISLSVLEQLLSMYISTTGGLILILNFYYPVTLIPLLVSFVLLGYLIFKLAYRIARHLLSTIQERGYLSRLSLVDFNLSCKKYFIFIFLYAVLWLAISVIVKVLLETLTSPVTLNQFSLIIGAYMIGVTAGFLAFFSPGGIGVREGIFVAITGTLITPALALKLSLLIRLWNTIYDLVAGLVGYLSYLKRESKHTD